MSLRMVPSDLRQEIAALDRATRAPRPARGDHVLGEQCKQESVASFQKVISAVHHRH
jgi:hypothetical protein